MDRNLALELVRVTEGAAIAAARWHGRGDKNAADGAAVKAMRDRLNVVDFYGVVVSGEGEKDEAPMLYTGEEVGTKEGTCVDIAVDPLECTTNLSLGKSNSMAVIAIGEKGGLLPTPGTYMEQLTVGPAAVGKIDITASVEENILSVARATDKDVAEIVIAVLDRERNKHYIEEARAVGARVTLFDHGTVANGIASGMHDTGVDMMWCSGGAPEAVITACALRSLGGDMQARFRPHNEKTEKEMKALGFTQDQVFGLTDLAKGKVMFVGSGVTSGPVLKGVKIGTDYTSTHSVVMRSATGTIRFVEAMHRN
jgi:fructose-1,6-bisphosphatase II